MILNVVILFHSTRVDVRMPELLLSSVVDHSTTRSRDPVEVETDSARQPCTLGRDCENEPRETSGIADTMLRMEWARFLVQLLTRAPLVWVEAEIMPLD